MNRILIVAAVFSFLACAPREEQPAVPVLEFEMETIHEIGSDTTAWFAFPRYLVTDSLGRIVVGDIWKMELMVFDSDGNFQQTIVREGPGPAEIERLRGLGIDRSGNLLVYDAGANMVKKFTVDGMHLASHPLPEAVPGSVEFVQTENHHLLFYSLYNPGTENNYLMHRYDSGFDTLVSRGVSIQSLKELEDPDNVSNFLANDTGSHLLTAEDRLLFAPVFYGGVISGFSLNGNAGEPIDTYRGVIHKQPYTFVGEVSGDRYVDAGYYTRNGSEGVLLHNHSKGLFRLSSGAIIHFTYVERKDGSERVLGAELFDEHMNLQGYGELYRREFSPEPGAGNMLRWEIAWKDADDRFYIIDRSDRSGEPKIRIVKFHILGSA